MTNKVPKILIEDVENPNDLYYTQTFLFGDDEEILEYFKADNPQLLEVMGLDEIAHIKINYDDTRICSISIYEDKCDEYRIGQYSTLIKVLSSPTNL